MTDAPPGADHQLLPPGARLPCAAVVAALTVSGSARYDDGAVEYFVTGDPDVYSVERRSGIELIRYMVADGAVMMEGERAAYLGARFQAGAVRQRRVADAAGILPGLAVAGTVVETRDFPRADDQGAHRKILQQLRYAQLEKWCLVASTRIVAAEAPRQAIAPQLMPGVDGLDSARLPDFSALISYAYLAGVFYYAHFAAWAVAEAWAPVMFFLMIGEYVLAFAVAFMPRVPEVAGENANVARVFWQGVLVIAAFLLPFLWFVVGGLWKVSPPTALGYVATLIGRLRAAGRADADERLRTQLRISVAVLALIGTGFIFLAIPDALLMRYRMIWGASYFAILAGYEIRLMRISPETLRRPRRRTLR